MSSINATARRIIYEQGRTQLWVYQKMNSINPQLKLNRSKFSAIMNGSRRMSADEFIAFCQATGVSHDEFLEDYKKSKQTDTDPDPAEEVGA